ncbi:NAD(P)-binding protein [Sodiomyces alkalinus F11]|uniref:NAD(P)-binding protein n=1 Tax=Sodiomyces alkalinus (strain CBS 110278 / VKM F-3762 / F11) TaxID=1314773 RepID=A0A3N2PJP6_SODAK|nr:NAD(P)-binding protein [Sodiomyces alkalinus F11]ROT34745.1 NAD(P)-binding protein [Sodiomyces alkalinus F11]
MDSVKGKYAVVTGGGSGIGLAFVQLLLSKGCSVLIGDLKLRDEAAELLTQYPHPPTKDDRPSVLFQETDVASWPQLHRLWDRGLSTFPRIDILCPAAGIFEPAWSNFWQPPKTATNPDSPSRDRPTPSRGRTPSSTQREQREQREQGEQGEQGEGGGGRGCIVFVSSVAGHTTGLGSPLYFASKNGLTAFVRSLGDLHGALGIRCAAVAPGAVMTPLWLDDPEKVAWLEKGPGVSANSSNFCTAEEIAESMLLLCREGEGGTILEVTRGGSRVVPQYNAEPPSSVGVMVSGYSEAIAELRASLKKGLKV